MPPHGHHHHHGGGGGWGGGRWRGGGPIWYGGPAWYDAPVEIIADPVPVAVQTVAPTPSDAVTKSDLKRYLVPAAIALAVYYLVFKRGT